MTLRYVLEAMYKIRSSRSLGRTLAVLLVLLFFGVAAARAEDAKPLKGIALVIGQSRYEHLAPLANPQEDARRIEALLAQLGFDTRLATDDNARRLKREIDGFIEDAADADVALLYYSGHGIEAGGVNYLLPIDADLSSLDAADEKLVALPAILDRLRAQAKITIVLLDACRSNPFPAGTLLKPDPSSPAIAVGVAGLSAPKGMEVIESAPNGESLGEVIGFAAEPGHAALDGDPGGNSPYAAALLKHLSANGQYDLSQVMTFVTEEVYLNTQTRQRPWTNASLRRFLTFGAGSADQSGDDALITGERRKLLLTIAMTPAETRAAVESLARDKSLPLDPLYGMLKELKVDVSLGPEDLDKQLRIGAENLRKLIDERVAPIRKDPELVRLSSLADRAQSEGAIALARQFREKASARADELDRTLDAREAELDADRLELAATYAAHAGTSILAYDYEAAATLFGKAAHQAEGRDAAAAFQYKLDEASALSNHGLYKGDNDALHRAIASYDALLLSVSKEAAAADWGTIQHNRGIALSTLGQRDSNIQVLLNAVAAYEAALSVRSQKDVPLKWAATQNNLGLVLENIGERKGDTAALNKAITAYEAALSVYSPSDSPYEWSTAQNNLGAVLQSIGQLENGTATLKKAAAVFEAAIAKRSREDDPVGWGTTQNNLANVLSIVGDRELGTESLKKAVNAYEAALSALTRDRAPVQWATIQSNLGTTLNRVGEREGGTDAFVKAVSAFEASLSERTRERAPLDWGQTQNNLGTTLYRIGEQEKDSANLHKAIAAYELALSEITREKAPLLWATIQNNLGSAYRTLGERELSEEWLAKAIAAYEAALTERTKDRTAYDWAMTQDNLGWARMWYGLRIHSKAEILSGRRSVEEARDLLKAGGYDYDDYFKNRLANFDMALSLLEQQTQKP